MPRFQPVISVCYNFVYNCREQRVTIVVSPTRIGTLLEATTLDWTCSRGAYCSCATCVLAGDVKQAGGAETEEGRRLRP